jgi:hypothetical protein
MSNLLLQVLQLVVQPHPAHYAMFGLAGPWLAPAAIRVAADSVLAGTRGAASPWCHVFCRAFKAPSMQTHGLPLVGVLPCANMPSGSPH